LCLFPWGTASPHVSVQVCCLCLYIGFWTDHSRIATRVDENQLVRVKTNNFMWVVRLCLVPITGFSVNLASNYCVTSPQVSTEHLPPTGTTRTICTTTLNLHYYHTRFVCSISYAYDSPFSTFSSIVSRLASGSSPRLYPILIHQIPQQAVGRLGMVHSHLTSMLVPRAGAPSSSRHGPKIGGCALFREGELGPHLTQCRLPPYQNGILIHPAVWASD